MRWSFPNKRSSVLAIGLVGMILSTASTAGARTESFRWYHTAPDDVVGFRIYWGEGSGDYSNVVDVGKPTPDSDGVYDYDVTIPDSITAYMSVTAYDADGESGYSNEKVREGSTPPPPPPPPPGGSGPDSAVLKFKLWNADSDAVIDSNFESGETIDLDADGDCVAIEVIGNAYLSDHGSPGSVMYAFDGNAPSSCSDAGTSHENNPPYAWEADEGPGQFACAPSLMVPGNHTLTVTPFDGDDCSGAMGEAATIGFEVLAPALPPPADQQLGVPGPPFLLD